MRKVTPTTDGPRPLGIYSQAIVADGFVFVAGQASINPKTNECELGDIKSETRRTLENIRAILEASGRSLRDVARVGVFLTDINDFAAMNEVCREFFPEDPPALVIDRDVVERKLDRMASLCREQGVGLRPHTKTHKTPEVARMQLEGGAVGLTVAKVSEAEVMVEAGLDEILVAFPIFGGEKLRRSLREKSTASPRFAPAHTSTTT